MAIVCSPNHPEGGFLILTDRIENTGPFIIFSAAPDRKYPLVSLRRPPELCGIDEPTFKTRNEFEVWRLPFIETFSRSLQDAYDRAGIKKLRLAAATDWKTSLYADLTTLQVESIEEDVIL